MYEFDKFGPCALKDSSIYINYKYIMESSEANKITFDKKA